jgi:cytochrome oxidase assembly protein ShyY1
MYRFLATPKWIGFAALMAVLAATMVVLGLWQLSRYHERSASNARVDAATGAAAVPVGQVLSVGRPPPARVAWTKVRLIGVYDPQHEILARDRTVDDTVGFEILTPLVLDDGTAVLVDRGWLPPGASGALAVPRVPAAPTGEVTVVGRVHLAESRPDTPRHIDGVVQVRRIDPDRLASDIPHPLYGGYVLLDSQQPAASHAFSAIPTDHQDSLMNAGYVVQWWAFALLTLGAFGWAARREARGPEDDFDFADFEDVRVDAPISPAV